MHGKHIFTTLKWIQMRAEDNQRWQQFFLKRGLSLFLLFYFILFICSFQAGYVDPELTPAKNPNEYEPPAKKSKTRLSLWVTWIYTGLCCSIQRIWDMNSRTMLDGWCCQVLLKKFQNQTEKRKEKFFAVRSQPGWIWKIWGN